MLDDALHLPHRSQNTDVHSGGAMNYHRPANSDFASLFTGAWFATGGPDLALSATFDNRTTTVPEPWSLLLVGSAGLAAFATRRKPRDS